MTVRSTRSRRSKPAAATSAAVSDVDRAREVEKALLVLFSLPTGSLSTSELNVRGNVCGEMICSVQFSLNVGFDTFSKLQEACGQRSLHIVSASVTATGRKRRTTPRAR